MSAQAFSSCGHDKPAVQRIFPPFPAKPTVNGMALECPNEAQPADFSGGGVWILAGLPGFLRIFKVLNRLSLSRVCRFGTLQGMATAHNLGPFTRYGNLKLGATKYRRSGNVEITI